MMNNQGLEEETLFLLEFIVIFKDQLKLIFCWIWVNAREGESYSIYVFSNLYNLD
jgi:hypothetical protein